MAVASSIARRVRTANAIAVSINVAVTPPCKTPLGCRRSSRIHAYHSLIGPEDNKPHPDQLGKRQAMQSILGIGILIGRYFLSFVPSFYRDAWRYPAGISKIESSTSSLRFRISYM